MWVFSRNSFLSIVGHTHKPDILLVRSRFPGHIEHAFPTARVMTAPDADYPFRAEVQDLTVAAWLSTAVMDIDYPNFKGSIEKPLYARACSEVWHTLRRFADTVYRRHALRDAKAEPIAG